MPPGIARRRRRTRPWRSRPRRGTGRVLGTVSRTLDVRKRDTPGGGSLRTRLTWRSGPAGKAASKEFQMWE
eukprot:14052891-Alexandrium_andersonii.AAC.1